MGGGAGGWAGCGGVALGKGSGEGEDVSRSRKQRGDTRLSVLVMGLITVMKQKKCGIGSMIKHSCGPGLGRCLQGDPRWSRLLQPDGLVASLLMRPVTLRP
jgi:hypothetical protein